VKPVVDRIYPIDARLARTLRTKSSSTEAKLAISETVNLPLVKRLATTSAFPSSFPSDFSSSYVLITCLPSQVSIVSGQPYSQNGGEIGVQPFFVMCMLERQQ